ncbi:beta-lactamase family protein [Brevibacillus humidisoli]|uniref:serine hydrolase domain-containing protein n=1 Tax=Brevibacillus humidisoli TaxID=2895522 RepID=UPI001E638E64|nr:serine hydrolase domain-containing protein [Brevibacillus humidisoli]UFJ43417.1 beta-lactamase family protein [Brevibacillus humidisoli]
MRREEKTQLEQRMAQSLERGIAAGVFPGGVCRLIINREETITVARGRTETAGKGVPVEEHTVYDLASLTKVVVTLPLILLSVQAGRLSLTEPVVNYIPELRGGRDHTRKGQMTIYHLLTHTSGLPAWRPYFIPYRGREAYVRAIAEEAMEAAPGQQVVYSDLGFMLLGFLLERIWDESLDQVARRLLFEPLGMRQTSYLPADAWQGRSSTIAPTEEGNLYESHMVADYLQNESTHGESPLYAAVCDRYEGFVWREGVICGTVHDCNAHYGLAGVSGHAGLFSSIGDLDRYMRIWSEPDAAGFLDPMLRDFATRCQSGQLTPMRAVGWEYSATGGTPEQTAAGCSGGDLVSSTAFGHTGFTGTSIWHDPLRRATLITLTNRVHPVVSDQMVKWRKAHHNTVFAGIRPSCETEKRGGE